MLDIYIGEKILPNERAPKFQEHKIVWDDEKVSRLWNYYSRTPPYSDVYFSKVFGQHILRHSGLPLGNSLEILDFGCGPGFIWDHLSQLKSKWRYTALDFSVDSVEKVIEKAQGHENFKSAHLVSELPTVLPAAYFDVVLLFEVVEHLNDAYLDGTLAETARLLKKGGVVVITTPNEEDLSKSTRLCPDCGAIFHEWQHVRSWSTGSLTQRLKQHGFVLRKAKALDFTAQDFTVRGLVRKFRRLARKLFNGDQGTPHLIAVYHKQ
jgi:2-polyprenyl-3-methyl-5-hydroxy-6-metoxy-1,4-benzoquinol methylase